MLAHQGASRKGAGGSSTQSDGDPVASASQICLDFPLTSAPSRDCSAFERLKGNATSHSNMSSQRFLTVMAISGLVLDASGRAV